ncbi:MAG: HIT family protein [Candidatus Krumholzibacteriota bacterium]|nr:HIT family protein [Candidatus Krumholzibacteriota bacterium]
MDDCLFCKIVRGELPAHCIWEDARILAFLDISPGAEGHALIIPKAHARDLFDLAAADRDAVFAAARRVAAELVAETGAEGINLHQANGKAAGQVIFHFHLHLLPRRDGDGLRCPWRPAAGDSDALADLAGRLRDRLAAPD